MERVTPLRFHRAVLFIQVSKEHIDFINPYSPNATFPYSLKTSENLGFSDVFRGYRNKTFGEYGLSDLGYKT